jgi:hypothetical protein
LFARNRELVKTFVTLPFFAPFAFKQTLAFQASKQRVQRAFINLNAMVSHDFSQRVAILLGVQGRQDSYYQSATANFETQIAKVF